MHLPSAVDRTLRRFVLGQLEEEPRLEIEERVVTDPAALEALGATEDDLTEEYVEGTLTPQEKEGFERHFLTTPERRRHVAFLRAVKAIAASIPSHAVERTGPLAWLQGLFAREPRWVAVAASILVLSLGANIWLALAILRPTVAGEVTRAGERRGSTAVPEIQPAGSSAGPVDALIGAQQAELEARVRLLEAETSDLNARLDEEVGLRVAAEARLVSRGAAQMKARVPTFVLAASVLRGQGAMPRVRVSPEAALVRLRLVLRAELAGDERHSRYRATLSDSEGEEIWSDSRLTAEKTAADVAVVAVVPAHILSRGDYLLALSGIAEGGVAERLETYTFRVSPP